MTKTTAPEAPWIAVPPADEEAPAGRALAPARISSAACRWAAPRRSSGARPPRSATACAGCPTARPARARTGSCGSTRCSARCRSSRSARPATDTYRTLPKLRLRAGEPAEDVVLDNLGFAETAIASYKVFAQLKRDGVIPVARALPGLAADAAGADQRVHRPRAPGAARAGLRGARCSRELDADPRRRAARPARAAVGHAAASSRCSKGVAPAWFGEVRGGVLERLLRLSRHVPRRRRAGLPPLLRRRLPRALRRARGQRASSSRWPTRSRPRSDARSNWIHMPRPARSDEAYFAPLRELRAAARHRALSRRAAPRRRTRGARIAHRAALRRRLRRRDRLRLGTRRPGRGRRAARAAPATCDRAAAARRSRGVRLARRLRAHPRRGLDARSRSSDRRSPTTTSTSTAGTRTSTRASSSSRRSCSDGDILIDYSGGTGILLDRLRLRIFDRPVGVLIVDASAKFLRVAHEKYKDDPRFAARLLRFIKEEKRLQTLDEVLGPSC